ncbi:mRNA-degrading endonuclease RelE of RelBE toxin-antitoxin system [Methanofollis sp. W23]|nr:mRNA-degrading endonuclease RelE of RelBE toxin-antitoxin system [Methanofollis sp. W23]
MAYEVRVTPSVIWRMRHLPEEVRERILDEVENLARQPDPSLHVKILQGGSAMPLCSFRVGAYRAILTIHHKEVQKIVVVVVGHRSEVYRKI